MGAAEMEWQFVSAYCGAEGEREEDDRMWKWDEYIIPQEQLNGFYAAPAGRGMGIDMISAADVEWRFITACCEQKGKRGNTIPRANGRRTSHVHPRCTRVACIPRPRGAEGNLKFVEHSSGKDNTSIVEVAVNFSRGSS